MSSFALRCIGCGKEYPPEEIVFKCTCGGLLEVALDLGALEVRRDGFQGRMGVWRYRPFMPVGENARIITLQEGGTPLYRAERLGDAIGAEEIYVKNEGANPTGSFKDRGMTVGVTKALELGSRFVGCASTGNTSASLAAYAAKAGIKCVVLLPSGKIALGKLAQALLHGAIVISVSKNFDAALKLVREASPRLGIYLLNSINPWRLEGQKTEAFEVAEELGWEAPDELFVPVGNCGNISAIWKGFREFQATGLIEGLPRMNGIQAEGAAPVADAFARGLDDVVPLERPETIATAIRIGHPVNAPKALRALRESRGWCTGVSDREIVEAQRLLARTEGVGVEPASAASIAGVIKALKEGRLQGDERIVCITTGTALKDPEMVFREYEKPIEIEPTIEGLERALRERI